MPSTRLGAQGSFYEYCANKNLFFNFNFCSLFLGYGGLQRLRQQESVRHRQGHYHAFHVRQPYLRTSICFF